MGQMISCVALLGRTTIRGPQSQKFGTFRSVTELGVSKQRGRIELGVFYLRMCRYNLVENLKSCRSSQQSRNSRSKTEPIRPSKRDKSTIKGMLTFEMLARAGRFRHNSDLAVTSMKRHRRTWALALSYHHYLALKITPCYLSQKKQCHIFNLALEYGLLSPAGN